MPCDPGYPDDRLQVYLEDGSAAVLVTTAVHGARAARLAPPSKAMQVGAGARGRPVVAGLLWSGRQAGLLWSGSWCSQQSVILNPAAHRVHCRP